jgi:hypothetical protein
VTESCRCLCAFSCAAGDNFWSAVVASDYVATALVPRSLGRHPRHLIPSASPARIFLEANLLGIQSDRRPCEKKGSGFGKSLLIRKSRSERTQHELHDKI